MRREAPAKINLCLDLLAGRPDGYHEVESVLQAVSLADRLTFAPSEELRVSNPGVPPETDLVRRAAALFERHTGRRCAVTIEVRKQIPIGAGLGGGSSDAAASLRALRDLFAPQMPLSELGELSAQLGSDVPFFLGQSPIALARGRGERITPLPPREPLFVVIAWPREGLSTAEVYRASVPGPGGATRSVLQGARSGRNDLARAARELCGGLDRLLTAAETAGVPLAVTGSGSAAFSLYEHLHEAEAARGRLPVDAAGSTVCHTLRRWPWQGNPEVGDE